MIVGSPDRLGVLVVLLNFATANNTVAIVMANPIAKDMAENYGISKERTASLLDIFACISQSIIPYGVAISTAAVIESPTF